MDPDPATDEALAAQGPEATAAAIEDEIRAFAKEQVAAYKYPRYIKIIDELPKGPTGKIMKREIDLSEVG